MRVMAMSLRLFLANRYITMSDRKEKRKYPSSAHSMLFDCFSSPHGAELQKRNIGNAGALTHDYFIFLNRIKQRGDLLRRSFRGARMFPGH